MRNVKCQKVFTLFCLLIIMIGSVMIPKCEVSAASKYETKLNTGKNGNSVTITKSGTYVDTISHYGGSVSPRMAFSGDTAYYTVQFSRAFYLYSRDLKAKKSTFIRSLPSEYDFWYSELFFNGSIYFNAGNGSTNCACYRYYLKTGKLKKLCDAAYSQKYSRYLICDPSLTFGAPGPLKQIYVYDTKTDKVKKIENGSGGYSVKDGVIYYSHNLHKRTSLPDGMKDTFSVMTYNIKTGKKKTILKKLTASSVDKLGKNYIYYRIMGSYQSGGDKYYRFNLKTKKKTQISSSQYWKICYSN